VVRILFFFDLQPGVTVEEYTKFSAETDAPYIRSLPFVHNFEVWSKGEVKRGDVDFDILEIVDADSWEEWEAQYQTPGGASTFSEWAERWGSLESLRRVVVNPF